MVNYSQALKCAILSQEIYKDFTGLKFSGFSDSTAEFIDLASTDTQCALIPTPADSTLYIVFRGSEKRMDWNTNLDFEQKVVDLQESVIQDKIVDKQAQVYPYAGESKSGAKMHRGFVNAFLSVREQIHRYLKSQGSTQMIVTGHSLGGALATLCAVDVQYNFAEQVKALEIYTFGSPRVGNDGFRESFNRRVPNSYRFVYGMDIVPALPRPWQGYRHVDTEYRLGPRFSLNFFSRRFQDHSIVNYVNELKKLAGS